MNVNVVFRCDLIVIPGIQNSSGSFLIPPKSKKLSVIEAAGTQVTHVGSRRGKEQLFVLGPTDAVLRIMVRNIQSPSSATPSPQPPSSLTITIIINRHHYHYHFHHCHQYHHNHHRHLLLSLFGFLPLPVELIQNWNQSWNPNTYFPFLFLVVHTYRSAESRGQIYYVQATGLGNATRVPSYVRLEDP